MEAHCRLSAQPPVRSGQLLSSCGPPSPSLPVRPPWPRCIPSSPACPIPRAPSPRHQAPGLSTTPNFLLSTTSVCLVETLASYLLNLDYSLRGKGDCYQDLQSPLRFCMVFPQEGTNKKAVSHAVLLTSAGKVTEVRAKCRVSTFRSHFTPTYCCRTASRDRGDVIVITLITRDRTVSFSSA